MSGQSAKRQKTAALALACVPTIDDLPPELLEAVVGFMDVRTLCTARLVCKRFRGVASRYIHSVGLHSGTLHSQPETTLNNFPNLSRISVFHLREDDLLFLAQRPIGAIVTHVQAVNFVKPVQWRPGLPLRPLPNLTSLTVSYPNRPAFPFSRHLRELRLKDLAQLDVIDDVNRFLTRLTKLTCLQINVQNQTGEPFEAVTALTALERLEMRVWDLSVMPLVAKLTLLTHLQIEVADFRAESPSLACLTRLDRLVHLGVEMGALRIRERQILSSMSAITSLRSLELRHAYAGPEQSAFKTVCMTPFSQLTALRLASSGLDASFLPRFNLERLQELALSKGVHLNRQGVAALRRATRLTHLDLCSTTVGGRVGLDELGIALSHMPRLRALSLHTRKSGPTTCFGAIGLLTELTRLVWEGDEAGTNTVVEACLGLKKLRALEILPWDSTSEAVTPEIVLELATLPQLSTFKFSFQVVGWELEGFEDHIRAQLNVDRHAKGWAPLNLNVDYSKLPVSDCSSEGSYSS